MKLGVNVKEIERYDLVILLMAVALTCFGVVMVYSASSVMATKKFHDGFYFLKRQGIYALMGFGVMTLAMRFDYRKWREYAVPILLGCLALLVLVFIPGIGGAAKGASRWIRLPGFNFQPSELAKIALIMYMAYSLDKKQEKVKFFSTGFAPYMVLLALLLGILLKQHDLGAALTMGIVAIIMLFVAGTRPRYILGMGVLAVPFICYVVMTESYRMRRIKAFLNPWEDPTDTGFQIIQSWLAFGNGGIIGQGLGEGKQKMFYLPEAHTDFILSVTAEELGLIGVIVIAAMFLMLVLRSVRVALMAEDTFGRFLAFGIATLLGIQAFVNMAVVTGLLPTKGLALPFISYGGSSLIVTLFAVGVLLNVSTRMKGAP
ncbi:putative lipid II flippase FtsW [Geobacter sp.]|uniref:putative lipid II flippase FtsW n=1 Tax=Geobacter sp. TaxID=46610 RepID=UPI0026241752|nr:putative lipid II flippase FtsW [Geobacter sp.]